MMRRVVVFGLAVAVGGCGSKPGVDSDRAGRRLRTVSVRTAESDVEESPGPAAQGGRAPQDRRAGQRQPATPSPAIKEVDAIGELTSNEPCATRLHAIAGTMLLYYATHRRLPARLEELRRLADIDEDLQFACPTSGQPYVYVPTGLRYQDKPERLVLYDAEPAHDGQRWGIVAALARGERPAATWAVRLPEDVFRAYVPETPNESPAAPGR